MTSIAIITARGGSKRIPRKNIKAFCGRPILAYSVEAARESGLFDEVMVSTDDAEIVEGRLAYNYPEYVRTRSQDLPTWYHDAGQFYFGSITKLVGLNSFEE